MAESTRASEFCKACGAHSRTRVSDLEPQQVILRYFPVETLRLAGFYWPEVPEQLGETPYLFTEQVGSGRVIGFTGEPVFRDMWRGLLPIYANAVLLGASF